MNCIIFGSKDEKDISAKPQKKA